MNKPWIAVVMSALTVGVMVGGVVWGRPSQSAQAAGGTRKLTIPAAFFHTMSLGYNYWNNGDQITTDSGGATFTAPVVFPCQYAVRVERIILSVKDQNGSVNACVQLYRTKPSKGTQNQMPIACSAGSQPGVINYTEDTIDIPVVTPSHGPYLLLNIGGANIEVYGVQIEYKKNT
jgi:hypothetical protein